MYFKIVVFLCAASLASAGELLQAAAPVAYNSQSFSSRISHAPVASYEDAAYAAGLVVAKSYAPSVSYHSIFAPVAYAKTYAAPAVATYSAPVYAKSIAPAVSYSSISSPQTYASATPLIAKTYAAPAYTTTYSAPIVAKTISPAVSYSSYSTHSGPIAYAASTAIDKIYAAPAIATYSSVPVLKSAETYSAAAAVSYDGSETKYAGW